MGGQGGEGREEDGGELPWIRSWIGVGLRG